MGFLHNLGSGLQQVAHLKEQLLYWHQWIDQYQIPVKKIEDNLDEQLVELEKWSHTNSYSAVLKKGKRWKSITVFMALLIGFVIGGIYVANLLFPEHSIQKQVFSWMFDHIIPVTIVLTLVLLFLLISVQLGNNYLRSTRGGGKAYQQASNEFHDYLKKFNAS
ncbi:DUF6097 family protein [Olivibacter sp. CPCC 100613]|uniref:DUF6097 family protein n=1 Tax=Olivibacter sp. CPCC 100613 TaxID=3079931 RepID=UPI002FF7CCBD